MLSSPASSAAGTTGLEEGTGGISAVDWRLRPPGGGGGGGRLAAGGGNGAAPGMGGGGRLFRLFADGGSSYRGDNGGDRTGSRGDCAKTGSG